MEEDAGVDLDLQSCDLLVSDGCLNEGKMCALAFPLSEFFSSTSQLFMKGIRFYEKRSWLGFNAQVPT